MTLNLTVPQQTHSDFTPKICVIGVGGGGTNAVDNMIALNLPGVEFIVANTDAQQLMRSRADRRIQLGPTITQGNGAGGKPEVGRLSAEEAEADLERHLEGVHMVFITAGMGGGTGTGAAPVIARLARKHDILTVGVVTKPFSFEGIKRARSAEAGIAELQQYVDTLIIIPNQNLFRIANEHTSWKEAFQMADNVLYMGVRGVTDLMVVPGLVNLDFADIRTVMSEMGKAMMGTGEAEGEGRSVRAAEAAISNPLLEDTNMAGARGLLINITGGDDMTLFEVDQAANRIREEVDEEANIIFGSAIDSTLNGRIRVSVVATGIDSAAIEYRPKLELATSNDRIAQPAQVAAAPAVAEMPLAATGTTGMQASVGFTPTFAPAAPQWSPAQQATPMTPNLAPAAPLPSSAPALRSPAGLPQRPASTRSLFAEPVSRQSEPAAPAPSVGTSLFNRVTGAIGKRSSAPAAAASAPVERAEPTAAAEPRPDAPAARPARQAAADEMGGLEIPAFLRRQQS
ncbi:cell division protein FtsZ [Acidisoma cellulosilytica]|uniref:Cell division protein FtsZ n=1 Tax=Acidisoma cellulosilyticum TaxID=2802395 RepID=A0A963YZ05_9PROT|nr:cell division protein FtsZ [Acidisoma cellulosilyticum]MCB8878795.1 cell division protein FtsZ [Acidisoma cellulosilyticum]